MSNRFFAGVIALLSSLASLPVQATAPKAEPVINNVGAAADNPSAVTFPGFSRYVDIHGMYSVLMSGTPAKAQAFELGGGKYSAAAIEEKEGSWSVAYCDLPQLGAPPYDSKKQSTAIGSQTQAYVARLHGKIQSYKAHLKFGYQFRDLEGSIESGPWQGGRFRLNSYLAGQRVFLVVAVGKNGLARSPKANAFFDSFEVPGATAAPGLVEPSGAAKKP